MELADTSIWIDHFRKTDPYMDRLLLQSQVSTHPFVTGELALGHLRQRSLILGFLQRLPGVVLATEDEVLSLIAREQLFGLGLGYVDVHLLAAARLSPGTSLWTRDKRLHTAAENLGVGSLYA